MGDNTIAKVQLWLQVHGEGFKTVLERTAHKHQPSKTEKSPWQSVKKKYPKYFWPQLLLEEIVNGANKREKERLLKIVDSLKDKTKLSKDLLKILK